MPELAVRPEDLEVVIPDDLSDEARRFLDLFTDTLSAESFNNLFAVSHADGAQTIIAEPPDYPSVSQNGRTYSQIHMADFTADGGRIGEAYVEYYKVDDPEDLLFFHDRKPFVGWNGTRPDYRKRGLGRRRLMTMNAASLLVYGSGLSSSFSMKAASRSLWEGLVKDGFAEELPPEPDNGYVRYKFLEPEPEPTS